MKKNLIKRTKQHNGGDNTQAIVVGASKHRNIKERFVSTFRYINSSNKRRIIALISVLGCVGAAVGMYIALQPPALIDGEFVRVKTSKEFSDKYESIESPSDKDAAPPTTAQYDELVSIKSDKPYYFYVEAGRHYRGEGESEKAKQMFVDAKRVYLETQAAVDKAADKTDTLKYLEWEISGRTTSYEDK